MEAQAISPKQVISAYSRLLSHSANKRYGVLDNDFKNDFIGQIAQDYNQEIIQAKGLDLFQIEEDALLIKYEEEIRSRIHNFTVKNLSYPEAQEEAIAMNKSFYISIDRLKSFNISTGDAFKAFPTFGIIKPTLGYYFRNPEYVNGMEEDGMLFVFATCKIKIRNRNFILLYQGRSHDGKNVYITSFFFLNTDNFIDAYDSPLKMLFRFIKEFGMNIRLDGNSKKFYYSASIPAKHYSEQYLLGVIENATNTELMQIMVMKRTYIAVYLLFYFVINMTKYKNYVKFY